MARRNWHTEIIAWSNGIEVERRLPLSKFTNRQTWHLVTDEWLAYVYEDDSKLYWEYRIKQQSKKSEYLHVYISPETGEIYLSLEKVDGWEGDDGDTFLYYGKTKMEIEE